MIEFNEMMLAFDKGNMLMGDWEIIYKFLEHRNTKVELGTANGLTSILIATSGGWTTTIDKKADPVLVEYLKRFNINHIIGDTADSAALFEDKSLDFLFIDADHSYEGVKRDYFSWYPKMEHDAVILFHDVTPNCPGVLEFYENDLQNEIAQGRLRELIQKPQFRSLTKVFVKA